MESLVFIPQNQVLLFWTFLLSLPCNIIPTSVTQDEILNLSFILPDLSFLYSKCFLLHLFFNHSFVYWFISQAFVSSCFVLEPVLGAGDSL